jgi:hypothetical protein
MLVVLGADAAEIGAALAGSTAPTKIFSGGFSSCHTPMESAAITPDMIKKVLFIIIQLSIQTATDE